MLFAEFVPLRDWGESARFVGLLTESDTNSDCAQSPTADSLLIFTRFSSIEEWTYRSSVTLVAECPKISESDFISKPTSTARVANVCRRV